MFAEVEQPVKGYVSLASFQGGEIGLSENAAHFEMSL